MPSRSVRRLGEDLREPDGALEVVARARVRPPGALQEHHALDQVGVHAGVVRPPSRCRRGSAATRAPWRARRQGSSRRPRGCARPPRASRTRPRRPASRTPTGRLRSRAGCTRGGSSPRRSTGTPRWRRPRSARAASAMYAAACARPSGCQGTQGARRRRCAAPARRRRRVRAGGSTDVLTSVEKAPAQRRGPASPPSMLPFAGARAAGGDWPLRAPRRARGSTAPGGPRRPAACASSRTRSKTISEAAWACSLASGSSTCSKRIGSPNWTVTFGNWRRFQLRARSVPAIAVGTTGAPDSSASRPMPVARLAELAGARAAGLGVHHDMSPRARIGVRRS